MDSGGTARRATAGLGLESLTRGQRYTAGIALAFVVALVAVGGPDGTDDEVHAFTSGVDEPAVATPGAGSAGVGAAIPAAVASPPEPSLPEPVTFTTTPLQTTVDSAPPPPPPPPPPTTTTTTPPADDQQTPPTQPSPLQPILDLLGL